MNWSFFLRFCFIHRTYIFSRGCEIKIAQSNPFFTWIFEKNTRTNSVWLHLTSIYRPTSGIIFWIDVTAWEYWNHFIVEFNYRIFFVIISWIVHKILVKSIFVVEQTDAKSFIENWFLTTLRSYRTCSNLIKLETAKLCSTTTRIERKIEKMII